MHLRAIVKEDAVKPVKPKPQPTPASDQALPLCECSPHEEPPPWRQVFDRRVLQIHGDVFNRPDKLHEQYCASLLCLLQDPSVLILSYIAQCAIEVIFHVLISQAFLDLFYSPLAICPGALFQSIPGRHGSSRDHLHQDHHIRTSQSSN